MNENVDLERWQSIWQGRAEGPDIADLQDRIARETRRRKAALVAPVAVTVTIGGWITVPAWTSGTALDIAIAVEGWLFAALTWAVAIWIDRRAWRPLGRSTASFLDFSIHRCRGDIAGIRAGVILYAVQFAAILAVKEYFAPSTAREVLTAWPVILIGWVGFPALLIAARLYGRRKRQELDRLIEVRAQLSES